MYNGPVGVPVNGRIGPASGRDEGSAAVGGAPGLSSPGAGLEAAARAARAGADATAQMVSARAGRSSYLAASALKGVADPGAVAIAAVFEAIARAAGK